MKDYLAYQGTPEIGGSRDAARAAFAQGIVTDGEGRMKMIKSRTPTTKSLLTRSRIGLSADTPRFLTFLHSPCKVV